MRNKPLTIGSTVIQPGERLTLGLPTPELYSYASLHIPVHIIHGKKAGPTLLICAAIHGDEMNGTAIIHRLLNLGLLKGMHGTLIAIPVMNVFGLTTLTRNLPDRRDLDVSFPGSEEGSFAARLAHYLNQEILSLATHCIDIHSGEPYQHRIPQIHTNLKNPELKALAHSFQPPVILHTESKRGLLWQNQKESPIHTLIYDAGEPLRLDEACIRIGFRGILRVMRQLNMLSLTEKHTANYPPTWVRNSEWVRSPGSGLCQLYKKLGVYVKERDTLATVYDPFGTSRSFKITSPTNGIILAHNTLPLVNEGDPILQVAQTEETTHSESWQEHGLE